MASGDAEKHELNEPWAIWEQREQGKNMSYGDKLFKLCTFSTVEEFWGYWNNIRRPGASLCQLSGPNLIAVLSNTVYCAVYMWYTHWAAQPGAV